MNKAPETWTLPEPVQSAWRAHRNELKQALQKKWRKTQWILGGGSVLSAQWNHRVNTDIDITAPELQIVPSLESLSLGQRDWPYDPYALTGCTLGRQLSEHTEIRLPTCSIDMATRTPCPEGLEHEKTILGQVEKIESNAQILYGKIKKTARYPRARDAYDLGVSLELDPISLAQAVNSFPRREIAMALYNLLRIEPIFEQTADEILDPPEHFRGLTRRLSTGARRALEESVYAGVRLEVYKTETRVVLATRRGTIQDITFRDKAPDALLRETALDLFLWRGSGWRSPPQIIEKMLEAQSARTGRTVYRAGSL